MIDDTAAGIAGAVSYQRNLAAMAGQQHGLFQHEFTFAYQHQFTHARQDLLDGMVMLVMQDFGDRQYHQLARDVAMTAMQAELPGRDLDAALAVEPIADDIDLAGRQVLEAGEYFCRPGWTDDQNIEDIGRRTHEGYAAA